MNFNKKKLRQEFDEVDLIQPLACQKFIKKPDETAYSEKLTLRVGDHYNGQKDDVPFHDSRLIKTILKIAEGFQERSPQKSLHLYIPQHGQPHDRTIIIYGNDEQYTTQAVAALREVFTAYRNDDLHLINAKLLIENHTQAARAHDNSITQKSNVLSIEDYLNGADVDAEEPTPEIIEDTIGRIKFSNHLDVNLLEGAQKKALGRLRQMLQEKLNVQLSATNHEHCLDIIGAKDDVRVAYFVGRSIAPLINEGLPVTAEHLNDALRRAKRTHGVNAVNEILGTPDERTMKKQIRTATNNPAFE